MALPPITPLPRDPTPAAIVAEALVRAALRAALKPKARARLQAEVASAVRHIENRALSLSISAGDPYRLAQDYAGAADVLRRYVEVPAEVVELDERRAVGDTG